MTVHHDHVETETHTTRLMEYDDLDALAGIWANDDAMRYMHNTGDPLTDAVEDIKDSRLSWRVNGFGPWVIVSKDTAEIVGRNGFGLVPDDGAGFVSKESVHFGCLIARDKWNTGIGAKLMVESIAWGFTVRNFPRIYAFINPENPAPQHVVKRLGMKAVGDSPVRGIMQRWYLLERDGWNPELR